MSTAVIWILIPLGFGALLLPVSRFARLRLWVACILSLLLALLALFFPSDLTFTFSGRRYIFSEQFLLFGRSLFISSGNLTLIALLYLLSFFWNLGSRAFKISKYFNALSLMITALWVAVLAVQPFLYSAVLIELLAMISIPLLTPRSSQTQPGVLRYLIFQTLAIPLILLSGWMLSGIATAPSVNPLIFRASAMVFCGFFLWLGIFPLHSWLPMLSRESHPWVLGFLLNLMQTALSIFMLYFLNQYAWLRNLPQVFEGFQWVGVLSIAAAGLASALQKDLRREFGYLYLAETGYSLLALGLSRQGGLPALAMLLLPRSLVYLLWAYALSTLNKLRPDLEFTIEGIQGLIHQLPFTGGTLILSILMLAGLPLFGIFPEKRLLWFLLPNLNAGLIPLMLIGVLGMLILALRMLHAMINRSSDSREETLARESPTNIAVMVLLILTLMAIGTFPHIFLPWLEGILTPFPQLQALL